MMKTINNVFVILLLLALAIACNEDPLPDPKPDPETEKETEKETPKEEASQLTQKVNGFIKTAMNDIYLWYQYMPDIDIRYEMDSKEYFNKLLYNEDKWSFITDDVKALESSFEGVETSFGYSLAFGRFSNTGNIFALVEYVYPNTPAALAGLKRGDIIVKMNGSDINDNNYRDLLYAAELTISLGILGEGGISVDPNSVKMTAEELTLDPVLITDIIEHEGTRIGYLFYAQFISNFNTSLDTAFQFFQNEGITNLILDFRYNPGGGVNAAQYLCSSVAPTSVVNSKSTLVTYQWNDKYQNHWKLTGETDQIEVDFINTTNVKMGLNKLYILTGGGTASASELTITGLKPYMDVITVGETTYGKYTGSITLKPEFYFDKNEYDEFENWGLQPIVLRYANSQGVTDFKDGFIPDIPAEDDLFSGIPLGARQDPLIKAAIEDITGSQVVAMKKAKIETPYTIFDRGFSKYDANKRELLIDLKDFSFIEK
jgi:carboxyl-terminal processing protease